MRRYLGIACVCCLLLGAGCSLWDKDKMETSAQNSTKRAIDDSKIKPAPQPQIMPETYLASGRMLEKQGDVRSAIGQYERAIAANPKYVAGYNQLGMAYQNIGQMDEAERFFKEGLKADPNSAMLYNNLGYCHLAQQRFPDAEREFRAALELNPAFKRARMNLGLTLANSGREAEAFLEFREVVPDDVAHYNLAMIAVSRRDYAAAEKSLRQALAINPRCAGANEQLARLQAIARGEQPTGKASAALAGSVKPGQSPSPGAQGPVEPVPLAGTGDPEEQNVP
jgi:Flp pilus assembly protein TadD